MAKICEKCGKKPSVGHLVSHSNIKTLRRYEPNLAKRRMKNPRTGNIEWVKVCTACLRTMVKPPRIRGQKVKEKVVA